MWILPEGNEVGVAEEGTEEGQHELPHLRVSLHVTPPDLGQQRLEEKRKFDHFHQLKVCCVVCVVLDHYYGILPKCCYLQFCCATLQVNHRQKGIGLNWN